MTGVFARWLGRAASNEIPVAPPSEPSLPAWFTADHRDCDERWIEVERAIGRQDAEAARAAFARFDRHVRAHLAMEEEVLFPAVEEAGLPPQGPTRVMRHEHVQMRALLDRISVAMLQGRFDAALEDGDALYLFVQQHNEKEEGMLYPMAERLLEGEWDALRARLEPYLPGSCGGACGCGG